MESPVIGREKLPEAIRKSIQERLDAHRALLLDERGFATERPAITVEKAVEILNERKHRDFDDWKVSKLMVLGIFETIAYTPFDAVAIAEKYERDK